MGDRDLEGFLADLDGGAGRPHVLTPSPAIRRVMLPVVAILGVSTIMPQDLARIGGEVYWVATSIALLVGTVGLWIYRDVRRHRQRRLNEDTETGERLDHYVLYLRPFTADGVLRVPANLPSAIDRTLMGPMWEVELALSVALGGAVSLVAIGRPVRGLGARRVIVSTAEWRQCFLRLAARAGAIIMTPSASAGSSWEMEQVAQNPLLRAKSILVMLPAWARGGPAVPGGLWGRLRRPWSGWFQPRPKRLWEHARAACPRIELPAWRDAGGFLYFTNPSATAFATERASFHPAVVRWLVRCAAQRGATAPAQPDPPWPPSLVPLPKARWDRKGGRFLSRRFGVDLPFMLWAYLVIVLIRGFVVEPFHIPNDTMMPTLFVGDFIAVNKFSYALTVPFIDYRIAGLRTPARGDVAVFRVPSDPSQKRVSRVVGLPGDRVEVHDNNNIIINDKLVPLYAGAPRYNDECYVNFSLAREQLGAHWHEVIFCPVAIDRHPDLPRCNLRGVVSGFVCGVEDAPDAGRVPPFVGTVPAGQYFVLADNRDNGLDSRYPDVGFVPEDNFVGWVFIVWWHHPLDRLPQRLGTRVR